MSIALVTCSDTPNLVADDIVLLNELLVRGIDAAPVVWDDPAIDWSQYGIVLLRETWDYHLRLDEFLEWVDRVAGVTRLFNPASLVRWNAHKGYLRDLEARGVPIIPTIWLSKGSHADYAALIREAEWQKAVIKPMVSASAFETRLFGAGQADEAQAHLDRLLPERDLMVQMFIESVHSYGERSLMFIQGAFTHSVRRTEQFVEEGTASPTRSADATSQEIVFAASVLQALPEQPLYARVDIARGNDGNLRLMELELIEPSLFFDFSQGAAKKMADALENILGSG